MEELYNDGPAAPAAPEESQESMGKTALLPKSSFPNAKPGDKLSVEVTAVHGEEIEVTACCGDDEAQEEMQEPEEQEAPASAPTDNMEAMMQ
jgi:hypothetical protein